VIQEVRDVLDRDKFDRYVSREDRHEFLEELAAQARLVEVTERLHVCRDPKDDMYLELEVSGNADVIVSGDEDLLVLHPSRASLF
jgi:putative PIN family toxin of toxin-antitoxin system